MEHTRLGQKGTGGRERKKIIVCGVGITTMEGTAIQQLVLRLED